jgi:hypothetical protein
MVVVGLSLVDERGQAVRLQINALDVGDDAAATKDDGAVGELGELVDV